MLKSKSKTPLQVRTERETGGKKERISSYTSFIAFLLAFGNRDIFMLLLAPQIMRPTMVMDRAGPALCFGSQGTEAAMHF